MKLKFEKRHKRAKTPQYAKDGDACLDLVAADMDFGLDYIEYDTGLAVEIPEGYVGLVFPRSSVTKTSQFLGNSVGVIDASFRGTIRLRYKHIGDVTFNQYTIGHRVGQLMVIPRPHLEPEEVDSLEETERGEGGFGSTGK